MRIAPFILVVLLGCQQQPQLERPAYVTAADIFLAGADTLSDETTTIVDSIAIADLSFELGKIPDLLQADRAWDQDRTFLSNDTAWVNYLVQTSTGTEMLQVILVRHRDGWRVIAVAVPTRI